MQFFLLLTACDVNERISSSTRCSKHLFEKGRESEESSPKGKGMGGGGKTAGFREWMK